VEVDDAATADRKNSSRPKRENALTVQIVEILGPSDQGRSRPYKCRGEDDEIYYVKGRQTDRASLWHEWVCGHLAQRFGLNVPTFEIVDVGEDLLRETPAEWRDLGVGPAFGSRLYPSAVWMEVGLINSVPIIVQRDVLVFDWWIRNCDRLTGNTNLLVDAAAMKLVVIDHNLAFDINFSHDEFLAHHVFASHWAAICSDLMVQAEYSQRLSVALEGLTVDCHNVPKEWHWANTEMDVPADFDLAHVQKILNRCTTTELWRPV
jgi:hypothetical protein